MFKVGDKVMFRNKSKNSSFDPTLIYEVTEIGRILEWVVLRIQYDNEFVGWFYARNFEKVAIDNVNKFQIGNRVRCLETDTAVGLHRGNEYTIKQIENSGYYVYLEGMDNLCLRASRFEKVEEDKVKKISKWEDLDGLENGMGLKLFIKNQELEILFGNTISNYEFDKHYSLKNIIEILKAMGFKIEYHKKKTVAEVVKEFEKKDRQFEVDDANYCLSFDHKINKWSIWKYCEVSMFGAKYYAKEVAEEFLKALNEAEGE